MNIQGQKHVIAYFLLIFLFSSSCVFSQQSVNYFLKTLEGSTYNLDTAEAKYAYMLSPSGMCLGLNNDLFVSDVERHLVFRIYDNLATAEVYAGYITSGNNGDGLPAVGTLLNTPTDISVDPLSGDLYIADTLNDMIRIVSNTTRIVSTIQSNFNRPRGIHASPNGFVYIADTENHMIKKYEISTKKVSIIGGGGYLTGDYDGVDAKLLKLQNPKNLHVVSNGKKDTVYFTDEERVKSIDENGIYRMVDGGMPQSNLYGIFVSNQGEIYTSSQTNHFIQMKFTKSSQTQLYFGSSSSESGYSGDNQSSNITFYQPSSLVVTQNSIFIADKLNNCVRKINLESKVISTIAGGLINHPNGENISPLKMYSSGSVVYPFIHKDDFYFLEKSLYLRKVSNGKMTTVLGCEKPLPYTANILQRTYLVISFLAYLGNGDVYLMCAGTFYNLNLDTQMLTLVGSFGTQFSSAFAFVGTSFQNATIYHRKAEEYINVFKASDLTTVRKIDTSNAISTNGQISVIPNLRYNESVSVFIISIVEGVLYEYIDFTNGSTLVIAPHTIPIPNFFGFSQNEKKLYFYDIGQLFEMSVDTYSLSKMGGYDPYNVSGTLIYPIGFNGEDILLSESALNNPQLTISGSKSYVSISNSIREIRNGKLVTVAGLTPISKTLNPLVLMRDPLKKIIYFLDNRTLKKYDENTGISKALTKSIYLSSISPFIIPSFFSITQAPGQAKSYGFLSTFDRKIYLKDVCRVLRIDPDTLDFETIIGKSCSTTLVAGLKGVDTPCIQSSQQSGMTFDESNGDILIAQENGRIFRYSLQTQLISLEFEFNIGAPSSDGIITNQTSFGDLTNIRNSNGYLYFSTAVAIRRIEKLSDNTYYLRTIVGNSVVGYSGDRRPALESSLDYPSAFYVKKNGDIIILDGSGPFNIRMYQQQTGLLLDLAGSRSVSAKYNGDGYSPYSIFAGLTLKQVEFDESTGEIFLIDGKTYLRKVIPTCSGNYTFNSVNSTCDLLTSCNGSLATSGSVCNSNGICSDFEVCQCKNGFEGRFCEIKKSQSTDTTVLVVAIVIPIVASLLLIIVIIVIVVIVVCSQRRKKRVNLEITQIDTKNVELSDNPFFSEYSSTIVSSSINSSIGSENENPFSRYSNIIRIGQGAFGSIFKVNDTKNRDKLKAIKLVKFESLTDLNTLMKEASQLSCVNHPNIVKVNDYFITTDSLLIIDMDYYEMGDLAQLKPEYCTEKLIKQILKQTLNALAYVHEEMHTIHRDIKPSNIFVKKLTLDSIEIVLADFGLAKKYQESKGHSYAGTPLYMSPEVALGSSYTFNTDIFSLGVSIYQIMTNDKVTSISNLLMGNQSGNASKILTNQMKESSNQVYSDELIEIVLKMVEKDANTRSTASQLLALKYFK